jgi:poly(A)-specific ribonuclease
MDFVNIGAPGGLNGYQRRLVHQLVRNEFPGYRCFARRNGEFMQIEKLDKAREARVSHVESSILHILTIVRSQSRS